MLRTADGRWKLLGLLLVCAGIGGLAAALVLLGNPGNMGLCGACFLRDTAGSLGLFASGSKYFRPEVAGIILGAFVWRVFRKDFVGRSGSHAASRFFFGVWMGIGALVFLGCPFRMLQRIGGGDVNAMIGAGGFLVGVGAGQLMERLGYSPGKTAPAPMPVGWMGPLIALILMALAVKDVLLGDESSVEHANPAWSLGIGLIVGAALALTGFCTVSAARQIFAGPRRMLIGALLIIGGYAAVMLTKQQFRLSMADQPIAHPDWLWNMLAMALVGLTGVLAGGCPVRQLVMAGEGNGDALMVVVGLLLGGAIAHNLYLVASSGGVPIEGKWAVGLGLLISSVYGIAMVRMKPPAADPGASNHAG